MAISQSSKSCTNTVFLPQRVEIEHILALRAVVSEIWDHFVKLPYLGMKLGHQQKCQKLHIYPLSTPGQRGEIELIFPLWATVSEIWADFKIAIFGHKSWPLAKVPESCTYNLFLPQEGEIEHIFTLQAVVSEIRVDF